VGPTGLVATAAEAVDIRGQQGQQGQQGDPGAQGNPGAQGDPGATGAAGPNEVTTATDTDITGLLKGNGTKVAQAVAGTDYAAGNDSRLPTSDQKAALAGTQGTPSASNPFVTEEDYRVSGAAKIVQAKLRANLALSTTLQTLTWTAEANDNSALVVSGGDDGKLIIPDAPGWGAGLYEIELHAVLTGTHANAVGRAYLYVNNVAQSRQAQMRNPGGGSSQRLAASSKWLLPLAVGDVLEIRGDQSAETGYSIFAESTGWFVRRIGAVAGLAALVWGVGAMTDLTSTGSTATIYQPASIDEWIYSHAPGLAVHDGTMYAAWGLGRWGESYPGNKVVFATSANNGATWSAYSDVVPQLAETSLVRDEGQPMSSDTEFVTIGGVPWLITEPTRWASGYRESCGTLATRITDLATTWVHPGDLDLYTPYRQTGYPTFAYVPELAEPVAAFLALPENRLIWDRNPNSHQARLEESTYGEVATYTAENGQIIGLGRRRFAPLDELGQVVWMPRESIWNGLAKTPIPNDTSKPFVLALSDGRYVLLGNLSNISDVRNPLSMAVSDDGLVWDRWYKIRELTSGGPTYDPTYRNVDVVPDGRGGGPQYPSAIEHDGSLYIVYSVHKERIELRVISLAAFA
jgi:hypothetical protein